ncbi:MAG: DNA topoisomerase 3 [Candidatus Obscuribacterales bacterium]|nr:DNA topoisomerase 3 [Candidatus Obscuribacterales bacterium]
MKVILAEKPSVARDIAAVVGANEKKSGYLLGNGYAVTYAFGHLVTFAEPEQMNSAWGSPWRLEQLPMIPEKWKYTLAPKAAEQFGVIKKLLLDSGTESIVCATDAGREGEHIFRLIYKHAGCNKPVERLWISSLTAEAIKDGLAKLKPASEFDNLADAAAGRAQADWIVGLNFTRAYTAMNRQLCTIGRVQTPTLALIVERQKTIDNFQSANFYEIPVTFEPGFIARYITPGEDAQTRLQDKAAAQAILDSISSVATGIVKSVVTAEKKTKAPALYDLLTLQKEANKRFGYTAKETLDIAQTLYEEYKLISYPRTESRHLSNDMVDELPGVVRAALKAPTTAQAVRDALTKASITDKVTTKELRPHLSKAYLDDNKLTDHHAIIPTHKACPPSLPEKQRNIYQLVSMRFLAIFLPPELRDETTAIISLGEHLFRARGVVIKDQGWTIVEPKADPAKKTKSKEKDSSEEAQQLPALAKGQELKKTKAELKERKTSAPKPYDDATLLAAMKSAGQDIDDEDLATYMKQKGLGTPATRAAIIERLLQTGYIERQKKALAPTDKGKALIEQVHAHLKDVKLTASWEQRLADMQDGKLDLSNFENEIAEFVRTILPEVAKSKSGLRVPSEGDIGACPQCEVGSVRFTPKGAGCNRWKEGCTFSIWREQYGKELKDTHIKELLEHKRTKLIKGFKKKSGKGTYQACLVLNEEFKVRLDFTDGTGVPVETIACPQCKKGEVRPNSKGVGCSLWREGCTFFIWKEQFGKELTDEQIKVLIENRRTELITGFKKKSGNGTYDARLVLNEFFKVRLEFENPAKPVESPVEAEAK